MWQTANRVSTHYLECVKPLESQGTICFFAGGMRPSRKRMPTKLCVMVEARFDQPDVPANVPLYFFQAV